MINNSNNITNSNKHITSHIKSLITKQKQINKQKINKQTNKQKTITKTNKNIKETNKQKNKERHDIGVCLVNALYM